MRPFMLEEAVFATYSFFSIQKRDPIDIRIPDRNLHKMKMPLAYGQANR
jgi:hypothetical protein